MNTHTEIFLVKSPFVQTVLHREVAAVWHSLFGKLKMVPNKTLTFLDEFRTPRSLIEVLDDNTDDKTTVVQELLDSYYLITYGFDERALLAQKMAEREISIVEGSLISYLGLIVSEECNFRCSYCIHFNNLKTSERINSPRNFMRFDVAKEAIDQYLLILRRNSKTVAKISFGGGEPLLAWPVIKRALEYCISNYGTAFTFRFSLATNASLVTLRIARVLKEYQVEVVSSLDGLREGNDRVRLTKTGDGTFKSILTGFRKLETTGYPLQVIGITINKSNFSFLDERVIDLVAEHGVTKVHIDVDVIGMVTVPIKDIIQRIMQIRRYAKALGIDVSGFWARPARNLSKSAIDPGGVAFCGAVQGKTLCISPSGRIYSCGYSNVQFGTLTQIETIHASGQAYHRFVRSHLTGVMEMCKGCMIEGQCGGGCNITQEFAWTTKTAKIERMCNFYRLMTQELLLERLREA